MLIYAILCHILLKKVLTVRIKYDNIIYYAIADVYLLTRYQ